MIYITGDTHGDISCFKNSKLSKLTEKDILIVCGDFGFIWNPRDKNERKNLEILKKKKYTICFVDGAHENFDILNSYKPYRWKGGNTHKIADNIYHLMRGEIFTFEGKSFFVMGGGESDDAYMREENVSWWEDELPSAEDMRNGVSNIKDTEKSINYILTYEPPTVAKDILKQRTNRNIIITPLNTYLQELMENVQYMHWYFGSLHLDLNISKKMTAVFNEIIPIG
ncbi:MAG: metallophosphoesterase [Eubacteriales bacterium]|nr:metallophosphoesterase [Eubacteriales bacterium]